MDRSRCKKPAGQQANGRKTGRTAGEQSNTIEQHERGNKRQHGQNAERSRSSSKRSKKETKKLVSNAKAGAMAAYWGDAFKYGLATSVITVPVILIINEFILK